MSPAGTSVFGQICLCNSVMNDWQNLITSASDLLCGSKSLPPFPHHIGNHVNEFLNICSNPRNFKIDRFTLGWNLSPPLYGPIALLNCTLYHLFIWIFPSSSTRGTLNMIVLSGSTILSRMFSFWYCGFCSTNSLMESTTSSTAWMNSGSLGFFFCTYCTKAFVSNITTWLNDKSATRDKMINVYTGNYLHTCVQTFKLLLFISASATFLWALLSILQNVGAEIFIFLAAAIMANFSWSDNLIASYSSSPNSMISLPHLLSRGPKRWQTGGHLICLSFFVLAISKLINNEKWIMNNVGIVKSWTIVFRCVMKYIS